MKLTRNHYPVRYRRESFSLLIMTAICITKGSSLLKKVSENEIRMYTLCTLNGKELDTGHSSSPNSELSYCQTLLNLSSCWLFGLFPLVSFSQRLIWNWRGHECSRIWKLSGKCTQCIKKCRDFLGRDILGTTFFRAESSLIQSSCRSLRNLKS